MPSTTAPSVGSTERQPDSALLRRLVVVGPPGAGKSSQGKRLASRLGVAHLSTGDLLREEVRRESPLGKQARAHMDAGLLVPDCLVLNLLEHYLSKELENGFVLDGYPRTVEQARRFMRSLGFAPLHRVIELTTPDEVAVTRLTTRSVCDHCGHIDAGASAGRCNKCCGPMTRRGDDEEPVVRARLATYRTQTAPMLNFFRDAQLLSTVDGNQTPDAVAADLLGLVTKGRALG